MILQACELQLSARGPIMSIHHATLDSLPVLSPSQIADLRLAASHMTGPTRRAFEAEMTLKYCGGNPLRAEAVFGWSRETHWHHVSRGAVGLQWPHTLGRAASAGGSRPASAGRSAGATSPHVSHQLALHAADGQSRLGSAQRAGVS